MNVPGDLLYTEDHEWIKVENGLAIIGITEFAQGELGDVVFVQMPTIGQSTKQGEAFGTIEAVKAVADLYAPISGEIVEINAVLGDSPETINREPYGAGWIIKIKPSNLDADTKSLLNPAAYSDHTSA